MEMATFSKLLSVAAAFAASFVASVQPFYPEKWVAVPGLAGTYSPMRVVGEAGTPNETFVITKNPWVDPPSYELTVTMNGKAGEFEAAPFQLESVGVGVYFLDLKPKLEVAGNTLFRAHSLQVHSVVKVKVLKDGLSLAFLDKSALKKRRAAGKLSSLVDSDPYGGLLLTAPTVELQGFLKTAVADGLFIEHILYRR
ncbi:MAG: hypothetical protein AAB215_00270 [Planctomycetota bacterium]